MKTPHSNYTNTDNHHQHHFVRDCLPSSDRRSGNVDIVGLGELVLYVAAVAEVRLVSGLLHLKDLLLDRVSSRIDDFF